MTHTFDEANNYVLIAFKAGYYPDFSPLVVKELPRALALEAPRKAEIGETVTITVSQRRTGDPISEAGVWAITREYAENLRARVAEVREAGIDALHETDWEAELDLHQYHWV